MNTSKQVNAMIGLLFLVSLFFAVNVLNEPDRQATAIEEQTELFAERGAEIFVQNCRSCHGMEGLGTEEGAIGAVLNTPAFLILGEQNAFGVPETPLGEADEIRAFLGDSIACGRTNSVMPLWSDQFGGSLSDQQIDYLVTLITEGRWDLVVEIGHEEDSHQDPPLTREDIVLPDATGLAVTAENCGQYNGLTAAPFRERDPFAQTPPVAETPDPDSTPDPDATPEPEDPMVQGVPVGDYYLATCSACHGANREGGVGLPLTPDALTEPDDFYIETLTNGRAGTAMAAFGGGAELTPEEVQAMVTWLKTSEP